ncbi:MAG TPA: hypothetical protein VNH20_08920 [Candidatus Dormibacteraeota bacterium]|nr:hypothetical protein [Candidatus Dormibacteraeota bacterium]
MSQSALTLLVTAACLLGGAIFALSQRRDAFGASLALVLGFDAVACALVGLSGLARTRVESAQLQAFAVVVLVMGALFAAAGISMATLLRRRTGGSDLLELAPAPAGPAGDLLPRAGEPSAEDPELGEPPDATSSQDEPSETSDGAA